ncbi:MAG: hypothetical protein FJ302_13730 [Planctomycetes bacterium]|nr:hypothetical protein [Planctomycetota bacterium]
MATRQIIAELSQRIRTIERTSQRAAPQTDLALNGLPGLERLLGDAGWPRGCLVEWLAEGRGAGSTSLALWASRAAWRDNLLVMIDSQREWHAPAAMSFAVDLNKTVFIRPEQPLDALWSLEQTLRTRGIGAVVCDVDKLSSQACRRLQLAAETGGGLGILLRPAMARRQPSFAEYRFLVQPLPNTSDAAVSRRWRVELLRARRQFAQRSIVVELSNGSDGLCVAAELASATPAA